VKAILAIRKTGVVFALYVVNRKWWWNKHAEFAGVEDAGQLKIETVRSTPVGVRREEQTMSNHVYKIIQLAGSSSTSIEDAIETAIVKAAKTVRNLDWFEVSETRGQIKDGKVAHYQVLLNLGFRLED
jgi:flavin-binding protein dodecin